VNSRLKRLENRGLLVLAFAWVCIEKMDFRGDKAGFYGQTP